jgi:hypothetical protein
MGLADRRHGDRGAVVVRAAVVLVAALGVAACGEQAEPEIDPIDQAAREQFPDLDALYGGDAGIYRGCGPNGGVCHNSNEFPNLDSIGSILENIDVPCNQKRDAAEDFHDMCERPGDRITISGQKIEIAALVPHPDFPHDPPLIWNMTLRERPTTIMPTGEPLSVVRALPMMGMMIDIEIAPLGAIPYLLDETGDPSGRTLVFGLPDDEAGAFVSSIFSESGLPSRPDRIYLGDPNANGVMGADLGGRLIKPGDPERSYLLRRLTDPSFGPLMPRANCCYWTKPALRALWCWVDGLAADGSNALAPIDYDTCRPSSTIELLYPEPGPACETSGMCPVMAGAGTGEPTFSSIYTEVLSTRCSGDGCHDTAVPGGVDFSSKGAAYDSLALKIVPGDPAASVLWTRLSPDLCTGACKTMPLGRPPLAQADLDRIRVWIETGALDD